MTDLPPELRAPSSPPSTRALLVGATVASVVLPHVPVLRWIAWPLILTGTLAHELGHGVAGLMVGRRFEALEIRFDGSGVAHTAGGVGTLEIAWTALGGLVGPAVVAVLCLGLSRGVRSSRMALGTVGAGLIVAIPFLAGSLGTAVVMAVVGAASAALGWWGRQAARLGLAFLGVQLAVQVWTRSDYLFVSRTGRGEVSDIARIADALWGPVWFWGAAVGLVSLGLLAVGLRLAWGPVRGRPPGS